MKNDTNPLRVLFFTSAVEHRTFRKTVKMLSEVGIKAHYIGFTRYNYPCPNDGLETTILGKVQHRNYIKRFFLVFGQLPRVRRKAKKNDLVYCFSLDALILASLATVGTRIPIVYQVQDIRPILVGRKIKNRLSRLLEKLALGRVKHVVLSSRAFYESHFQVHYGLSEDWISVIENKIENDPNPPVIPVKNITSWHTSPIRIGYFGMLRCSRSWEILKSAVDSAEGRLELIVRGKPVGLKTFDTDVSSSNRIFYGGPYRSPDELDNLYQRVDLVWSAYPYGKGEQGNWQWARTVRFYEAGAFGKPMISQAETQDAYVISQYGIGLNIDMADPQGVIERLLSISHEELSEWSRNLLNTPRSLFIHTEEEYRELKEKLNILVGGTNELA